MTGYAADRPVVIAVNGADCSGATGLAADICTIAALGAHPAPVTTTLVARDTEEVKDRHPTPRILVIEQLRAVLEDSPVAAIKLGDTGDIANAEAIHTVLQDYPDLPLIFDPYWLAGDEPELLEALRILLLPRAQVLVVSAGQAHAFASTADNSAACASELLDAGCGSVLITGIDNDDGRQRHQWFARDSAARDFEWDCLPDRLQGVGSTLSAAFAAYLAFGAPSVQCCEQALNYTCLAMSGAYRAGMGRLIPDRLVSKDADQRPPSTT